MLIRIFVSLTFDFYFSAVSASPFSVLEGFSVTERKTIGTRKLERVKTAKKSYPKRNGVITVRNWEGEYAEKLLQVQEKGNGN